MNDCTPAAVVTAGCGPEDVLGCELGYELGSGPGVWTGEWAGAWAGKWAGAAEALSVAAF